MGDTMKANIHEGQFRAIIADPVSHALITIPEHESYMHEGKHWFIKTWMDIDKGVTPTSYLMFNTPPLPNRIHAYASLSAESEFTVSIFRDAVITDTGTPLLGQNCDQNSTDTHALLPSAAPTVSDEGTLLWAAKVGQARSAGVSISNNYEIIAKSDSNYLYKIEKIEAATHWLDVDFWWYEHISKEIQI